MYGWTCKYCAIRGGCCTPLSMLLHCSGCNLVNAHIDPVATLVYSICFVYKDDFISMGFSCSFFCQALHKPGSVLASASSNPPISSSPFPSSPASSPSSSTFLSLSVTSSHERQALGSRNPDPSDGRHARSLGLTFFSEISSGRSSANARWCSQMAHILRSTPSVCMHLHLDTLCELQFGRLIPLMHHGPFDVRD
jgi:hypothetical protein